MVMIKRLSFLLFGTLCYRGWVGGSVDQEGEKTKGLFGSSVRWVPYDHMGSI